jgi:SpoVK/Ycf46/Vps4 family AAA+-type ATPase
MPTTQSKEELLFHLRSLSRCIYFVTDEEDRFLIKLRDTLKKLADRTWVFNAAFGLVPLNQLIKDWNSRTHTENREAGQINDALVQIYKDDPRDEQNFYVITDPERWLADPHVVRRVLNILHQVHNDIRTIKILIFVGSRKVVPEKLAHYMEVVHDTGLSSDEILATVEEACNHLGKPAPKDTANVFKGLTSYQIDMSIAQSIVKTRKDTTNAKRIDAGYINEFRRRQLKKTDLVQYMEADSFSFDQVGGAQRFKAWAKKTALAWTEEGRKFGLVPPKGVLCVGIWGTGKSLSAKATGAAWGIPVVGLEMGRLRSSGVGESEANVYRAIRVIESAAPCLVWIDEAEKSLSGGASSAQSDAGTTSRTIGILSTWLQETTAPICLMLTANNLKTLPVEFINRADERFFFDMPSQDDRIDILKIHLKKNGQDPSDFNLDMLAEKAEGMVGREMEQAIKAAMIESFAANKSSLDETILANELAGKPRILRTMVDEVKEVIEWVGYDPERDEGVRARFASKPNRQGGALKLIAGGGGA